MTYTGDMNKKWWNVVACYLHQLVFSKPQRSKHYRAFVFPADGLKSKQPDSRVVVDSTSALPVENGQHMLRTACCGETDNDLHVAV